MKSSSSSTPISINQGNSTVSGNAAGSSSSLSSSSSHSPPSFLSSSLATPSSSLPNQQLPVSSQFPPSKPPTTLSSLVNRERAGSLTFFLPTNKNRENSTSNGSSSILPKLSKNESISIDLASQISSVSTSNYADWKPLKNCFAIGSFLLFRIFVILKKPQKNYLFFV